MGTPAAAPEVVYDIDVSPARSAAILGRDIVACTADPADDDDANGDIYLIGTTTTWTAVGLAGYDYTAVTFEPNWVGGRGVVAMYSTDITDANPGTHMLVRRTSTPPSTIRDTTMSVVGAFMPHEVGGADGGELPMITSSIDLPEDFDSSTSGGRQVYIGWNTNNVASDDAYRVDDNFSRKLGIAASVSIHSVSFSGTRGGGTLYAGESARGYVWYSENPQSSLPDWKFSYKSPSGTGNTLLAVAPDFATSNTVYAGTGGAAADNSCFARTTDGGVSFNELSLIDSAVVALEDVMVSPDGTDLFLATNDGADGSLWRSSIPPSGSSWERVRRVAGATGWIIRLSPEYVSDTTLYYCDVGGTNIQRSTSRGDVFGTRTAPANIGDVTVEAKDTLYMGDQGAANIRKSTNGAWFFDLPVAGKVTAVNTLAMAPTYPEMPEAGHVLVGGTAGGVALSTDGGASFAAQVTSPALATNMVVMADKNYVDNNFIYAASGTAGQGVYRYEVGVSKSWEQIRAIGSTATMSGLAMYDGKLYGAWSDLTGAVGAVAGDSFTIIDPTGAGDTGNIVVTGGSVLVSGNSATTVPTLAASPVTVNAGGALAWTTGAVATDTITVVSNAAGTAGAWTRGGAAIAGITTDVDGDASVAATSGAFSLPDAATGAVAAVGAGGVERSLSPTLLHIASLVFETMDIGAGTSTFTAAPSSLRLSGTEADIWLWAIDTSVPTLLAYNDTMALQAPTINVPAEVMSDPATGGNAAFIISWNRISNARYYEVNIYTDEAASQRAATSGSAYSPPSSGSPTWSVPAGTLPSGADYWARVRVRNQVPGDGIRSGYSSKVKFTVAAGVPIAATQAGPQLLGPAGGATTSLTPGFSWAPVHGASEYEFVVATNSSLTKALAGTPVKLRLPSYQVTDALDNDVTYFWGVRVVSPFEGPWSVGTFATREKAVAPPPPVTVPPAPTPTIVMPTPTVVVPPAPAPPAAITPGWIYAIIVVGAVLVIAVIVLIVRTRRVV
jgi:hypothetical protein